MIEDLYLISICIIYALLGALARALFGIYKAYTNTVDFRLNIRRVFMEICVSVLLGTFGVIVLNGMGALPFELKLSALVAGFIGADVATLIIKRVGLTKELEIKVTEEQVLLAEFNPRQIRALNYLKSNKMITNTIYQRLNRTSPRIAKYDLSQLVMKGKLKKSGKGKSTYYELA